MQIRQIRNNCYKLRGDMKQIKAFPKGCLTNKIIGG